MSINTTSTYDDEIDLRAVLQVVWKARLPILIVMLSAAVITFAVSTWLLPEKYRASAYVSIGRPSVEFLAPAGSLSLTSVVPDIKALPELVRANFIMTQVEDDSRVAPLLTSKGLSEVDQMQAYAVGTSQIRLEVTDTDRQLVPILVKVWAEKAADWIDNNYGIGAYAAVVESQIDQAQQEYDKAQVALESFVAQDQTPVLTAQVDSKIYIYTCLENNINVSSSLLQRLNALKSQLIQSEAPLSLPDSLILASIQVDFDTVLNCGDARTILLANTSNMFEGLSSYRGLEVIDGLTRTLHQRIDYSRQEKQEIQQQILELKLEIEKLSYEYEEYERQAMQAGTIYQQLTMQLALMDSVLRESGRVAVVSAVAAESKSVSVQPLLSAGVAAVIGLFLGVLGSLGVDWWRKP